MGEIIVFNKSFQERLQEYNDMFEGRAPIPGTQIKKEWAYYMEFSIDPNGWQALWKIPRGTCESLNITFPTIVLVYVESIKFLDLTASVKVIAVQDDIDLPENHFVSLVQLWPTKEQDKTVCLDISRTANCIDMLRFFYLNLYMPWDADDDTTDWIESHLERRLRLFFDSKSGIIPKTTAQYLSSLVADARRLQTRKELLESELDDDSVDLSDDDASNDERISEMLDIHMKLKQIRSQVEVLEDPLMRNIMIRNQKNVSANTDQIKHFLIFNEACIDDYIEFLEQAKKSLPKEPVTFYPLLSSALEVANKCDTIILNKARHNLGQALGDIQNGGVIKGIYDKNETVLVGSSPEIMLDLRGNSILENLTIEPSNAQCGILIRYGTVTIKNCCLKGNNKTSSTNQGIIVLGGSNLELIDCDINHFSMGIVANSGSSITFKNCNISNVNVGLKLFDDVKLLAENVHINNCLEYGICLETEKVTEDTYHKAGTFEILQEVFETKMCSINGENNTKGDVLIMKRPKLAPIPDLFSSPQMNSTKNQTAEYVDDDMDTNSDEDNLNSTVIEVV